MQYCAITCSFLFETNNKRLSSSLKMPANFHGLQIWILVQLGKSLLSPDCCCVWLFVNVLLRDRYGKAVSWSAVKVDPQHENQLFFASVITQVKTVNSIPNTKLNSQPQTQT